MKRLIAFILIIVAVYAVSSDARESRYNRYNGNVDTIYYTVKTDSFNEIMPPDEWFQMSYVSSGSTEYLHTDVKIFHGSTAQSVLDYFRAWEDSAYVEIVGAVDMEIRPEIYTDTLLTHYNNSVRLYNPNHRDHWHPIEYYLTVTYREWREE